MGDVRSRIFACGTAEPAASVRRLQRGPLSLEIEGGAVRAVRWQGVEIVRGVNCLVHDAHWGTYPAEAVTEDFAVEDDHFLYERRFGVADGDAWRRFTVAADRPGKLDIVAELSADRTLATNRAGLTLLHPIAGVASAALTLHHSNGNSEDRRLTEAIQRRARSA